MRSLLLLLSGLSLAACATTAPQTPAQPSAIQQTQIAPGECGLFGFTTDAKRDFVFYSDVRETKFSPDGETVLILTPQAAFPASNYLDPAGRAVSLDLGTGEAMAGGMRYPGARITAVTEEGWDRVMPLAVVKSCQSATR